MLDHTQIVWVMSWGNSHTLRIFHSLLVGGGAVSAPIELLNWAKSHTIDYGCRRPTPWRPGIGILLPQFCDEGPLDLS